MSLTVIQRPDQISSPYIPTIYNFNSDVSPAQLVSGFAVDNRGGFVEVTTVTNIAGTISGASVIPITLGEYVLIESTDAPFQKLNGVHKIREVINNNRFVIDLDSVTAGVTSFITTTGNVSRFLKDYSAVLDIFVDGVSIGTQRQQINEVNEFTFDIQDILKEYVGADLTTKGATGAVAALTGSASFYVQYTEEYVFPDANGRDVLTLQTFIDDSANTKLAIDSIVPYVEFTADAQLVNTDYSLLPFTFNGVNTGVRFLTEQPDNVEIRDTYDYQLGAIFAKDANAFVDGDTGTMEATTNGVLKGSAAVLGVGNPVNRNTVGAFAGNACGGFFTNGGLTASETFIQHATTLTLEEGATYDLKAWVQMRKEANQGSEHFLDPATDSYNNVFSLLVDTGFTDITINTNTNWDMNAGNGKGGVWHQIEVNFTVGTDTSGKFKIDGNGAGLPSLSSKIFVVDSIELAQPDYNIERLVEFKDGLGAVIGSDSVVEAITQDRLIYFPVGVNNLTLPGGTKTYEVTIKNDDTGEVLSNTVTFKYETACKRTERHFIWKNERGGFDSFTFTGEERSQIATETTKYNRTLNNNRVVGERQNTRIRTKYGYIFTANSGLRSGSVTSWLSDIMYSSEAYVEIDGTRLPIEIVTGGGDVYDSTEVVKNFTFDWTLAVDFNSHKN